MDDEKFFAWLDGELDPGEARRVAGEVAASPDLSARAEQHRRLAAGLRGAFGPVIEASPEPPRFASAEVVGFNDLPSSRQRRQTGPSIPQWAALAAALAFGLVVGSQFAGPATDRSPVSIDGGQLVAAADLQQALDTSLAGSPDGATRIGLTFRDRSGEICRSFSVASASGLACRAGGRWELRALFPAGEGSAGDYRMAGGQHPQLAMLIGDTIAGEPFDADEEKAARQSGWR